MPGVVYPFVADLVNRRLPVGGRVLEVGCGAMQYEPLLHGRYTGLDLSSSRHVERRPHLVASAEDIPADDASFDVVFGVATFYYMPDAKRVFTECRRVLRPGGTLLVFDYKRPTIARMLAEGDDEVKHVWDERELRATLSAAGFAPWRVRDLSHRASGAGDPPLARRPVRLVKRRLLPAWTHWLILSARR